MSRLRQQNGAQEISAETWRANAVRSIVAAERSGVDLPANIERLDADRLLPLLLLSLQTLHRRAARIYGFRRRASLFWGNALLLSLLLYGWGFYRLVSGNEFDKSGFQFLDVAFPIGAIAILPFLISRVPAPIEGRYERAVRRLIGVARRASVDVAGPSLIEMMCLWLPADTARTIPQDALPWLERLGRAEIDALSSRQIAGVTRLVASRRSQRHRPHVAIAAWLILAERVVNDPVVARDTELFHRARRTSHSTRMPERVRAAAREFVDAFRASSANAGGPS